MLSGPPLLHPAGGAVLSRPTWLTLAGLVADHEWQD